MKKYFGYFFLDREKDMIVDLYLEDKVMTYVLSTPNHHTGNLITNLANLCHLPVSYNEDGLKIIEGEVPCYITSANTEVYVFRLGNSKVANIYPDGRIEVKSAIPAIPKTLMAQTKDYKLNAWQTIVKTYIPRDYKFKTDLHTHMNAILEPDMMIAMGIVHQIRYPLYYIKKLELRLSNIQSEKIYKQRAKVEKNFIHSELKGKYLDRKIDDNVFINFADLILNNIPDAEYNIVKIRESLAILKDGQAVFTNLEKLYLYRYVFSKGVESDKFIKLHSISYIPDNDVRRYVIKMLEDDKNPVYSTYNLFQDKLLWMARTYQAQGIEYIEVSDTTLVKADGSAIEMLKQVHQCLPDIENETGVSMRFLAALRRTPLTLVKDNIPPENYLRDNLNVFKAVIHDPYVVGCDFVGEEINDIYELKPVIQELVAYCNIVPFTIRIHAGENDSLQDNVGNSIRCIAESLQPGQKFPSVRLGHGLYTPALHTNKGKQLLKLLKANRVILEFQLTSNVRLNNLTDIQLHPLKQYLAYGIRCVQGTDGAAAYGTSSMDEQIALERLLQLNGDQFKQMVETENVVIEKSKKFFAEKKKNFKEFLNGKSLDKAFNDRIEQNAREASALQLQLTQKLDATQALASQIKELPWNKIPIIIAGGSFNTTNRKTRMNAEEKAILDELLIRLDPRRCFFVIGNNLSGYEKYIVTKNKKFDVYAIVPSLIDEEEKDLLERCKVNIRVSTESLGMGIYKSFNYEIFERRKSILIALDGNSAGANLIQEAKNGKGKAVIYVSDKSEGLKSKLTSLDGYLMTITPHMVDEIQELVLYYGM